MNLKDKLYKFKENKRYKKFKNCSLPFLFYDKKRDCYEWVRRAERWNSYDVNPSLYEVLGNAAYSGLTYHYQANILSRCRDTVYEANIEISHGHSFEDVVAALYSYPLSFSIPDEFKNEYSEQELKYLMKTQKFLNLVGVKENPYLEEINELYKTFLELEKKKKTLKNIILYYKTLREERKLMYREKIECAENQKAKEYADFLYYKPEDKNILEAILSGQKQEFISTVSELHQKYFLIDNEYNYLAILEIVEETKMQFKELKEEMVYFDKTKYKNFLEYKNELKKEFNEINQVCEKEEFNDESFILYQKIKTEILDTKN